MGCCGYRLCFMYFHQLHFKDGVNISRQVTLYMQNITAKSILRGRFLTSECFMFLSTMQTYLTKQNSHQTPCTNKCQIHKCLLTWSTKTVMRMHDRHFIEDYFQNETWKSQQERANLFRIRQSPVRMINPTVFFIYLPSTWHAYVNETCALLISVLSIFSRLD